MFDRAYVKELENIIMDELLPMYIIGCRSAGRNPMTNAVLDKLMKARILRKEIPYLLNKDFSKTD